MGWQAEVARALSDKYIPRREVDWSQIELGEARLLEDQKGAITEAVSCGGGVLVLPVGAGKSLVALILTHLLRKRTLLLLPADLKDTMRAEHAKWLGEFAIGLPHMMSYAHISRHEEAIDDIQPELILADESFYLGEQSSTRTRRVIKYLMDNPRTQFVALCGTLGTYDKYATVMEMALGDKAPVAVCTGARTAWARMLDSRQEMTAYDWQKVRPISRTAKTRQEFQNAFRDHLQQAPGVYIAKKSGIPTSLRIFYHTKVDLGDEVLRAIEFMTANDRVPNGDVFAGAAQRVDACMQALQGFYYVWDWGTTPRMDKIRWLHARKAWQLGQGAYIDEVHKRTGRVLSPDQVAKMPEEELPEWLRKDKERFEAFRGRVSPTRRLKVLSRGLARWSIGVGTSPLVWHKHMEIPSLPALSSLDCLDNSLILRGRGYGRPRRILTSLANAVGKNLQETWHENVLLYLPGAKMLEQLIGRTHRQGQPRPEVHVHIPMCHPLLRARLANVKSDARDADNGSGERHKILYADEVWLD